MTNNLYNLYYIFIKFIFIFIIYILISLLYIIYLTLYNTVLFIIHILYYKLYNLYCDNIILNIKIYVYSYTYIYTIYKIYMKIINIDTVNLSLGIIMAFQFACVVNILSDYSWEILLGHTSEDSVC